MQLKVQSSELIDTKVLSDNEVKELVDLLDSIESDYLSENIELLNSLVESGKELVSFLTNKFYLCALNRKIMNNRTFTMIKPDATAAGNTGKIIDKMPSVRKVVDIGKAAVGKIFGQKDDEKKEKAAKKKK